MPTPTIRLLLTIPNFDTAGTGKPCPISVEPRSVQKANFYQFRMPAWLMDNVRRGGELVGGQGAAAPDFFCATLYRLRRWRGGRFEPAYSGGKFLGTTQSPVRLFE